MSRPAPRMSSRALLALTLLLAAACADEEPLLFSSRHVPVDHDHFDVRDVVAVDPDRDGDLDLIVATENDLRYLRREGDRWSNATFGTLLDEVAPVDRLHLDGDDLLAERDGVVTRLVSSGVGSWREQPASEGAAPSVPDWIEADLDGDGRMERVGLQDRRVRVEADAGAWRDVTAACGVNGLLMGSPGTRLLVGDVDGDGDLDMLATGGDLFLLENEGGTLAAARRALPPAPATDGDTSRASGAAAPPVGGDPARPAPTAAAPDAPAEPGPWFIDATDETGLTWHHREGDEQWDIRPTMGPGAAFGDVDGDGDPDLYVPGGADQDAALFVNLGHRFEERAAAHGLAGHRGSGMGALFADLDDDGDVDLYVTRDGPNVMHRNDDGAFTDVTGASGTGDDRWGASAACADVDRDGDLDLYVTNYLAFDPSVLPPEPERRREDPLAMLPYVFEGQSDVLYLNRAERGTPLVFEDGTAASGLLDPSGKGLGALFLDHDDDGWIDLYVANDTTPNTFHRNLGDGTFEEISLFVGVDDPRGGMGLAAADVDSDGDEDVLLTNWQLEPNALYRCNRVHGATKRRFMPMFEDIAVQSGLAQPSVGYVGWGCLLDDLDNDGDVDAFVVNGYTSPDYETTMVCVGQPDALFENVSGPGPFAEHRETPRWTRVAPARAGAWSTRPEPGRGLASADVDGDGDLDLVTTANNGPLVFLRNETGGRSLRVVAVDRAPREAVGTVITLTREDGRTASAVVRRGSGYLGNHQRGVHFGLGGSWARSIAIRWPDGTTTEHVPPREGVATFHR